MYKWTEIRDFFSAELNGWGRDCAVAGLFLTRLPFPLIKDGAKKGRLAAAMRTFPLIGVLIGAIVRGGQVITPRGDTVIQAKDRVVLFAAAEAVRKVEDLFSVQLEYF